jgi:plastocyanin
VTIVPKQHTLALVDSTLSGAPVAVSDVHAGMSMQQDQAGANATPIATGEIGIDNFSFAPKMAAIAAGKRVTWVNHDDVPHQIVSANRAFPPSKVLDTGERHEHVFDRAGSYAYFCSLHPTMTGTIAVR